LFFKVLRDGVLSNTLIEKIQMSPYSRKEFYYCKNNWRTEKDVIEKVRMWYVATMQSFSSNQETWSHSKTISRRGMSQSVSKWLGNVDENLVNVVEKLRECQIENLDFKKVISKYDSDDTLFYLDPPYVHETRKMTFEYDLEMTEEQHKDLAEMLLSVKGKCVLSGYSNEIYKKLEKNNWEKINIGEYAKRSERTNNGESHAKGEEFVWVNY